MILLATLGILLVLKFGRAFYEEQRIAHATIIVELIDELEVEFASKVKVSDFIKSINGEIIDDFQIDTTILGEKNVSFEYTNDEGIKVPYSFMITIVDNIAPIVWLGSSYSVKTNFSGTLEEKILCADNYDDVPSCLIEGEYDTTKVGKYSLRFIATDSSGNETVVPFTLNVTKTSTSTGTYSPSKISFEEALDKYKSDDVSVGIDISSWQGDINYDDVKDAGVEFAIVRVGSKWGTDGEYFLDSKFEQNMEGFNRVGIPVGAYFYSYAKNEEEARSDAEWVIDKLKNYDVDLPIAFDFEDWSRYNKYQMSLYRLNRNASIFIETLEEAGYSGMLYGSASYLNKLWNTEDKTVWVAHYTTNADYSDSYKFWQFSAYGRVDGINADVDLDIMYK